MIDDKLWFVIMNDGWWMSNDEWLTNGDHDEERWWWLWRTKYDDVEHDLMNGDNDEGW